MSPQTDRYLHPGLRMEDVYSLELLIGNKSKLFLMNDKCSTKANLQTYLQVKC